MKKLFLMSKDLTTVATFTGESARELLDQVVWCSEDFVLMESRMKGSLELKCIRGNTLAIQNDSVRIYLQPDYVVRYTITP